MTAKPPVSKVPPEWGQRPRFTMHNSREYEQMALATYFPDYLRLWFFAVANVHANGHLPLRKGHLGMVLGEEIDGVRVAAPPSTVRNAIAEAKRKGLLDPECGALCLRPTRQIVAQGKGEAADPCQRCDARRAPRREHLRSVS